MGALLNSYYRIEGSPGSDDASAGITADGILDVQGFDARQHFDGMVASGHLRELVSQKKDLDVEVGSLDGEMQSLVYKNYTKFTQAADVVLQMKYCLDGMEPDFQMLEAAIGRVSECQARVEDGVWEHSSQIDVLLKRQRLCKKLQVLWELPGTLKRCLDRGEYGKAVEAYCCCSDFLRQYKHIPTFKKVLEEVDNQMNQIGSALGQRLRSPYLSVDEAVNSSVTLLDMGKDQTKVVSEYLRGRVAVLKSSLEHCFCLEPLELFTRRQATAEADQQDLHSPESIALNSAVWRLNDTYVPPLSDAVEGFYRLQEGRMHSEDDLSMLPGFVRERVQEMFERLFRFVQEKRVSTRVLVSCVHSVRDAMRRLHTLMPLMVTELVSAFLLRVASFATRVIFVEAASALASELLALHGRCKGLQESSAAAGGPASANAGLDEVLEQIARTEHTMIMNTFTALTTCQPLCAMLGPDRPSREQFVRELNGHLCMLHLVFAEACLCYVGRDPPDPRIFDESLRAVERGVAADRLEELGALDWSGLFGLALVRIGRHLETKAINKVWSVTADLFADGVSGTDWAAPPGVLRATRGASQAVISHYVMVAGQRMASFFRNSIQNKNWMTVREPRKPSVLIETVILKEVHAFDAQLARILGDPKRGRPSERRPLSRLKVSMELEIERMVAKKLQVFAPIPFNRNGAIVGILKIAFKALFEYIREETFAKFGMQQIQVDCAFLADAARDFVEAEDANLLDSLLDEALSCASMRCKGPVLMDPAAVHDLIAGRKEHRGIEQP